MFEPDDFSIQYEWRDDGDVMRVSHLLLNEDHRGKGWGSVIIEMFVRFAYYEGATVIKVEIGGGDAAKECLERNGFHVYNTRPKKTDVYGVDAVRKVR